MYYKYAIILSVVCNTPRKCVVGAPTDTRYTVYVAQNTSATTPRFTFLRHQHESFLLTYDAMTSVPAILATEVAYLVRDGAMKQDLDDGSFHVCISKNWKLRDVQVISRSCSGFQYTARPLKLTELCVSRDMTIHDIKENVLAEWYVQTFKSCEITVKPLKLF